jgi:hypothetical protein
MQRGVASVPSLGTPSDAFRDLLGRLLDVSTPPGRLRLAFSDTAWEASCDGSGTSLRELPQQQNRQTHKQTDRRTDRQTERTDRQTDKQTDRQTDRQKEQTDRRQTDRETDRQRERTDRPTNRQTDKQTDRKNRQTDDRQTERQTDREGHEEHHQQGERAKHKHENPQQETLY